MITAIYTSLLPINAITQWSLLLVLCPLLTSFITGVLKNTRVKLINTVVILLNLFALILSAFIFIQTWDVSSAHSRFEWIRIGNLVWTTGILVDNISTVLLALILFIALLVQIFSIAYMKNEMYYARYFSYLNLFVSAMLGLILSDNLLMLYLCWELVGFCSYLLIGFWNAKEKAVSASKKAFIVNRVGDLGFLVSLFILYSQFHTFDISTLAGYIQQVGTDSVQLQIAGLGLILAAIAKSAQFPLHVWLPDAMEGPTPVSALIHAATMVVAGVYLLIRTFFLLSPDILLVVAFIGSFTSFMAATIALTQYDLKKVLAYSTISQLGYMIMAVGIGVPSAAFLHLITHAFFKCMLFLSAGVIIYKMKQFTVKLNSSLDIQDVRNLGGLRNYFPITFFCFTVGTAALVGLPFFIGFISKDVILIELWFWSVKQSNLIYWLVPFFAFATVLLTVLYMMRIYFLLFFGEPGMNFLKDDFQEPFSVKIPLLLLSLCCLFPFISINPFSIQGSWLMSELKLQHLQTIWVPLSVLIMILLGFYFSYLYYYKRKSVFLSEEGWAYQFLSKGWYIDKFYETAFVRPVYFVAVRVSHFDLKIVDGSINSFSQMIVKLSKIVNQIDRYIVDGCVNAIARITYYIGNLVRSIQTGKIQSYFALAIFGLMVIIVIYYFSFT